MKGWVYVISNKAMDGLVKVGHSTKYPELRAKELNNTGSPHPYIVEYELLIEEPYIVEQAVHKILSHVREGKEWFRCTPEQAVDAIKQIAGNKQITETFKHADRIKAEELRRYNEELHREKEAQEDRNRKTEALFKEKEQQIMNKYDEIIRDTFPEDYFLIHFGICFMILLFTLVPLESLLFQKPFPDYMLVIVAVVSLVMAHFTNNFFKERRKSSYKYKLLLQKRDDEIKALSSYLRIRFSSTSYIPEGEFLEEVIDDSYINKHYPNTKISAQESKKCPNCGIFNPENAQVCDCGFIFN